MKDEFIFDEKTHTYWLNGEKIPSVSQILSPMSRDIYKYIDKDVLENAARRGREVHKMIELTLKGYDINFNDYNRDTIPYYQAFLDWKRFFESVSGRKIKTAESERKGWCSWVTKNLNRIYIAGTADVVGDDFIIDFKTRQPKPSDIFQLLLYGEIFNKNASHSYIVGLQNNGKYKQKEYHQLFLNSVKDKTWVCDQIDNFVDIHRKEKQLLEQIKRLSFERGVI